MGVFAFRSSFNVSTLVLIVGTHFVSVHTPTYKYVCLLLYLKGMDITIMYLLWVF